MAVEQKILVINPGSASRKYALYNEDGKIYSAHFEFVNNEPIVTVWARNKKSVSTIDEITYNNSLKHCIESLIEHGFINDASGITQIGMRIVAPGLFFTTNTYLDENYLEKLNTVLESDPVHLGPVKNELNQVKELLTAPVVMISDSAFHSSMPDYAKSYAIDKNDAEKYEIYRFGYHGLSVRSAVRTLEKELGHAPEKIIVCHLGGGSSVTALKDGRSVDTSMGYSPLEGLPMATRVGNIDVEAAMQIYIKRKMDIPEIRRYFYNDCGIKGMSGVSADTRILLAEKEKGNIYAKRALDYYAHAVKEMIGAYTYVLGGLNMIVFTGTMGERSAIMRTVICGGLEYLDVEVDENINTKIDSTFSFIHSGNSKIAVAVVPTDEMGEIARQTAEFVLSSKHE